MIPNEIFESFQSYLLTEKCVALNTFNSYVRDLKQFFAFLQKVAVPLDRLDEEHLKKFIHYLYYLKLNARSISRKISTLKVFFSYTNRQFKMHNWGKNLCFPKVDKTLPSYLSEDEITTLLTYVENDTTHLGVRNATIINLLYVSGMRITELVELELNDINFEMGIITVHGKGGKERLIPIPSIIMLLLRKYITLLSNRADLDKNKYLFPVIYGKIIKSISRQSCWIILKKICNNAGIEKDVSPHQLRHSFATHMLKSGADLRALQQLLGHETISTVQLYTHVETSHLRKIYDKKHPRS
jgi:integrase/recombinase XerD